MGLFDGTSSSYHGASNNHRSHSYSGARSSYSPSRSGHYTRPTYARSSSSFFGGGAGSSFSVGGSRGIFGGSGSGSSYYKRRPRDGYIQYLMHRLQRMIKELWYYARRHPVKAFFAVIVPLLSAGGAIGGLLKQFGVRMPGGMMGGFGGGEARRYGGGYYGSSGYGGREEGGWMGSAGSLMQIAKAFM